MPYQMTYVTKRKYPNKFCLWEFDDIRNDLKDQNYKENPNTFCELKVRIFNFVLTKSKNPSNSSKEKAHSNTSGKLVKAS